MAAPVPTATLALGVAQKGPGIFPEDGHPGVMGELKLGLTGRDLGVLFEVRHAFQDVRYLDTKSRLRAGVDLFLAPGTTVFLEWERFYHRDDDWAFVGLRFDLARVFGG